MSLNGIQGTFHGHVAVAFIHVQYMCQILIILTIPVGMFGIYLQGSLRIAECGTSRGQT